VSRNLPPLRLLSVFEAVLRRGGARGAAAELNVSQPAVSQAIKQLEAHLGATLLDRGTRPPTLTEAGKLLHRATVEGLGRIGEAVEEIARLSQSGEQGVTIACSVGLATYWLMPRLALFYDRHPAIAVNVRTTQQGAPALAAGVDFAIRYGDGSWDDGEVGLLFPECVEPVASPALAAALRGSPRWFEAATLIHVDVEDETWLSWRAYLRRIGQDGGGRGLRFTNYVQATQAALAGQGVMLGWRSITGDLVREGRLAQVAEAAVIPSEAFYLVAAARPRAPEAASTVRAWLAEAR
jgi:DNA-binding transcriptional LysR family regulator